MGDSQFWIKIILIAIFVVFALVLVIPGRGARKMAVRRLALLIVFGAAIAAVAFPEFINSLANLVGVGRGTDLILYALAIVFIGNSVSASARHRQLEREVTQLARVIALQQAQHPTASETGVD